MATLFKINKPLIVLVSLLAAATSALADKTDPIGNLWLIYGVGTGKNNIVFVADLPSMLYGVLRESGSWLGLQT